MSKDIYDIAVIGAGAAGSMAAIRAAQCGARVLLLERNCVLGRKVLLTSNGRCNFTNTASLDRFMKKIYPNGKFYRTAFTHLSNHGLIDFFAQYGVGHKVEDHGRVITACDDARAVTMALCRALADYHVKAIYEARVKKIAAGEGMFKISLHGEGVFQAGKVILAAGSVSYPATGSSGDGFSLARAMGHSITALKPALSPLRLDVDFLKDVQGIAFSGVTLAWGRSEVSERGDILFAHFGLSGPLALDISAALYDRGECTVKIDFLPDITHEALQEDIRSYLITRGGSKVKTLAQEYLPKRMAPVFLKQLGIDGNKQNSQLSKRERESVLKGLKGFELKVSGIFPVASAMVTNGGIPLKEVDPRTMESKIVPGLYIVGEMLEGYCLSGGYNLQQAFSTGYLAGESAAK